MDSDNPKRRSPSSSTSTSTSTNFFTNIFKRHKTQSIRYEDTFAVNQTADSKLEKLRQNSKLEVEDMITSGHQDPLIVRFYDPAIKAKDRHGRTLDDILDFSDRVLENSHDYIQILFPLPETSLFQMTAPVITRPVFDAFRSRPELRAEMRRAWEKMMNFYGFEVQKVNEEVDEKQQAVPEMTESNEQHPAASTHTQVRSSPNPAPNENAGDPDRHEDRMEDVKPDPPTIKLTPTSPSGRSQSSVLLHPTSKNTPVVDDEEAKNESSADAPGAAASSSQPTTNLPITRKSMIDTDFPTLTSESGGSESTPSRLTLVLREDYEKAFRNWVMGFDHNHLRITRILRCLRVLGLQDECDAFYRILKRVYNSTERISARSMQYWRIAVRGPIWESPDGEIVRWLMRWEEEQSEMGDVKKQSVSEGDAAVREGISGFRSHAGAANEQNRD